MKKIISILVALLMIVAGAVVLTGCGTETETLPPTIVEDNDARAFHVGILSGGPIPAFALGRPGFETRLTELMQEAGHTVRFTYQNSNFDSATAVSIATTFAAQRVDLIFSMGTGASQQALPVATSAEIPLVFGIITDPVGAGLVTEMSTGSSSALPMETQVDLLEELLGTSLDANNRVAFLYTTDEDNSAASLGRLQAVAPEGTIVPFGIPANGLEHLTQQFINIAADSTIRAIYIPQDNQITEQMQMVQNLNRAQNPGRRLPIVVADLPIVEGGAVASHSVSFSDNGARAAELAFEILINGTWPQTFYLPSADTMPLYINLTEAEAIDFEVPDPLVQRADQTF
ncbi:MAG: ABC transporter substrate-binding protein [Oscillospiraceae bacterium]|nr:ABC transporter substrate-binding protein [Oscillospiraceae bacterium]